MEIKYCWRCKMEVPMLDLEEHAIASKLYSKGFRVFNKDRQERFKELLDFYNDLTGFGETEPNAIMHHSLGRIGPDCEKCGKPYRTPKAKLCAACGNKRKSTE
jgi:DNA-directed RNA polymerase subunit RPC12/RpoP